MFLPLSLCVTVAHSVCQDTIVHLMAKCLLSKFFFFYSGNARIPASLIPQVLHCHANLFLLCIGHFMATLQGKVHSSRFTYTDQAMSKGLYTCMHIWCVRTRVDSIETH